MALFTDGIISTINDLQAYDSAVLEVAKTEGVDLSTKLTLAEQEIALELELFLIRKAGGGGASRVELEQVVATAALKQWHRLRTLALVYGDVYNSQLNDRYGGKWREYVTLSKRAAELLFLTGVGIENDPVPRAKPPELTAIGGLLAAATYLVQVAWRNGSGETGAPSDVAVYTTSTNQRLVVQATETPASVVSYDVYVGLSEGMITKQNTTPVGKDDVWTIPATGVVSGEAPGSGQDPDYFLRLERVLQRG